jgi:hypothetical protein
MQELQLMHNYSTRTIFTFSATSVSSEVWKVLIVNEALKHEFLMDGILGLSALHLAVENPSNSREYFTIALEYQTRSSARFRDVLSDVTPDNCNAIFAFSVIAMMSSVVSTRFTDLGGGKGPTERIQILFELLEGIRTVTKTAKQWLKCGPLSPVLDLMFLPRAPIQQADVRDALDALERLNNTTAMIMAGEQQTIYADAITHLKICFSRGKLLVLTWLAKVGKEFMNELGRDEPMAILIFLHWGVLLDRLSGEWWVQETAKKLVEELSNKIRAFGVNWEGATYWARQQVI